MKTAILIGAILATLLPAGVSLAGSPEKAFEAAIYKAKVLGDLAAAIQQFEAIVAQNAGKPIAARALLEIGRAEDVLGHTGRSRDAYLRLVKEYPGDARLLARRQSNPRIPKAANPNTQIVSWVNPRGSVFPAARCCAAIAYDESTHSALLFGGFTQRMCFRDTWVWRNGWRQVSPATAPSARSGPAMAYDAAAKNVVLFGGIDSAGKSLNDTWTWDGKTWTQQFPPVSPTARRFDGHGMAYYAPARKVLIFGGIDGGHVFGDTWTWDGIAKTWTEQMPLASPSTRRTMIAYDEAGRVIVLFGGDSGGPFTRDTVYGDTWIWDGVTWSRRFPAAAPSARGEAALAFDPDLGGIVLFGGRGSKGEQYNDTWLWNASGWTLLQPAVLPAARCAAAIDYDPIAGELLLFGGFGTKTHSDTWVLIRIP
jgi:hypothetical protein